MILNINCETTIENPDAGVLMEKVYELNSREDGGFIILSSSEIEDEYMQACNNWDATFQVEYREGSDQKHYQVVRLGVEETLFLFQDYLRSGSLWRKCVAWRDISHTFVKDASSSLTKESKKPRLYPFPFPKPRMSNPSRLSRPETDSGDSLASTGVVYLLRAGPYFKIGRAKDLNRRIQQVKLQLPYPVEFLHSIETDDPSGIEGYWHRRFSDKRANGEWFLLSEDDVTVFISRQKM